MVRQLFFALSVTGLLSGSLTGCETASDDAEGWHKDSLKETYPSHYPYYDGQYTHDDENDGD